MRPPSVDALARSIGDVDLPHPLLVDAARATIAAGRPDEARAIAEATRHAMLRPVVNATGVLLHTNLGRAPLGFAQPADYTNLELSLTTGKRGSRRDHAGALLARACGAEAALVVNNGAAAVLLALAALARGGGVAVSRGELVEIGGGFRIPEVMEESGARLSRSARRTERAPPTTSGRRRRRADPEGAPIELPHHRLHRGCSGRAARGARAAGRRRSRLWAARRGVPVAARRPAAVVARRARRAADARAGAALVVFSGDKLLGGPQAGILAGRADLIDTCARHPLYRALRPGGLVLAALQQVALAYLGRDRDALPFWRMATVDGRRSFAAAPWHSARERCRVRVGDRWRHGAGCRDPVGRRRGRRAT